MRKVIGCVLLVGIVVGVLAPEAYADISGFTNQIGENGLKALASGFYALGAGIAVAGVAIGVGLSAQKK
jgi:hypothetical protein